MNMNEKMVIKMRELGGLYVDWRRTKLQGRELERVNNLLKNVDLQKAIPYLDENDKDFAFDSVWKMTLAEIEGCKKEMKQVEKANEDTEDGLTIFEIDGVSYDLAEGSGVFEER